MIRIYVDHPIRANSSVRVQDEFWSHYLVTVRRLEEGDELEVAGPDQVGQGQIMSLDPLLVGLETTRPAEPPGAELIVVQALTRKKKFERTVRLATELGVTEFAPVISQHTVREPNNPEKQQKRWRKIAVDAARIADRDDLPVINQPQSLGDMLEYPPEVDRLLLADPDGARLTLDELAAEESLALFVGPEGGFTDREVESIHTLGADSVGLEPENLRSGTAATAFVTLCQYGQGFL